MRTGKGVERQLVFLDFYNESNNQEYQYLETAVGDAVYDSTVRKYSYARIEKSIWQRNVRASAFRQEDFFNRDKIQTLGTAIPADGIVFGKFTVTAAGIKIKTRVLAVFSREIIADEEILVPIGSDISKEIQAFARVIARQVAELFVPSDRGAIWRSAVLPGWGQIYKGRRTAGQTYGGIVGTGFAFSLFSLIMWQTSYTRYRNYNPDHVITPQGGTELIDPAEAQGYFDRYAAQVQSWRQITLVSLGITLAIYLWQILDAWLFDSDHAQLGKRDVHNQPRISLSIGVMDPSQTIPSFTQGRFSGELYLGIRTIF